MIVSELTFGVDGVRCAATVYRPDQPTGEVPCVVMGHGLSLTRRDGIPDYAARFAAAELAAFAFDYRFWGDSDGGSRADGSRCAASSKTGARPSTPHEPSRAWTRIASQCGACPSAGAMPCASHRPIDASLPLLRSYR